MRRAALGVGADQYGTAAFALCMQIVEPARHSAMTVAAIASRCASTISTRGKGGGVVRQRETADLNCAPQPRQLREPDGAVGRLAEKKLLCEVIVL